VKVAAQEPPWFSNWGKAPQALREYTSAGGMGRYSVKDPWNLVLARKAAR